MGRWGKFCGLFSWFFEPKIIHNHIFLALKIILVALLSPDGIAANSEPIGVAKNLFQNPSGKHRLLIIVSVAVTRDP